MFINRRTAKVAWGDCGGARIVACQRHFEMFDGGTNESPRRYRRKFSRVVQDWLKCKAADLK
jgi:hypothetical protein